MTLILHNADNELPSVEEDGWYFLGVANELAQLVNPEAGERIKYIQTNLLDRQPWGYIVPFYYADELASLLDEIVESLPQITDSDYQVRQEAEEQVLQTVPRLVTSWETEGQIKHTLANVVFPIIRVQNFFQQAAALKRDVSMC